MANDMVPIGRFSPTNGLWVDRTDLTLKISGQMELYGTEANAARALSIQNSINTTWTQSFPDGYSVTCNITVTYKSNGPSGNAAKIEAVKMPGPSNVNPFRKMTLNANEANAFTWTAAHEFGHVIGLKDRYSESIISKINGQIGGARTNTVHPGYEGNIMAVDQGTLASRNLADIAAENAPSPYWMNGDNHIRHWVSVRGTAEIGMLPTDHKLKAIRVLMGGWISDDDMKAIEKICLSVKDGIEAHKIQAGINLLDFTFPSQRTQMRVIFTRMPFGMPLVIGPRTHIVEPGEWLSKIAIKYYGDVNKAEVIYNANKGQILDRDRIEPGMKLIIP